MRTLIQKKDQSNRVITSNKNVMQLVRTISIETESNTWWQTLLGINNQFVHNDANRIHNKKAISSANRFGFNNARVSVNRNNDIPQGALVAQNEQLIIVSHGSRPTQQHNSIFAGKLAVPFAIELHRSRILPNNYAGQIYLDGCHTGEPKNYINDGTSFAERFKNYLQILTGNQQFTVKGNLGATGTSGTGTDWVLVDRRSAQLIISKLININNNNVNNNVFSYMNNELYMKKDNAKAIY